LGRLPLEPLRRLIDARRADLDPAPFADDAALDAFLGGAYAAPMQAAAVRLDPAPVLDSLAPAARAWGLASLVRETPAWLAAGRRWAPPAWGDDPAAWTARARAETATTLAASRAALKTLPVASWPAVAHASLARAYVGGRSPGELERRVRIVAASLVGRI
jgi:phytoene synthase